MCKKPSLNICNYDSKLLAYGKLLYLKVGCHEYMEGMGVGCANQPVVLSRQ